MADQKNKSKGEALAEIAALKEELTKEKRLRSRETNALLERLSGASQLIMAALQAEDAVLPVDLMEKMEAWANATDTQLQRDLITVWEENNQLANQVKELNEEKHALLLKLKQWEQSSDKHY